MANVYPLPLYHGQPTSAGTDCYTPSGSNTAVVRHIRAVNVDSGNDHTIQFWAYSSGGSNNNSTVVSRNIVVSAGGDWEDDVYLPLKNGDHITAKADSNNNVTVFIGGAELG